MVYYPGVLLALPYYLYCFATSNNHDHYNMNSLFQSQSLEV